MHSTTAEGKQNEKTLDVILLGKKAHQKFNKEEHPIEIDINKIMMDKYHLLPPDKKSGQLENKSVKFKCQRTKLILKVNKTILKVNKTNNDAQILEIPINKEKCENEFAATKKSFKIDDRYAYFLLTNYSWGSSTKLINIEEEPYVILCNERDCTMEKKNTKTQLTFEELCTPFRITDFTNRDCVPEVNLLYKHFYILPKNYQTQIIETFYDKFPHSPADFSLLPDKVKQDIVERNIQDQPDKYPDNKKEEQLSKLRQLSKLWQWTTQEAYKDACCKNIKFIDRYFCELKDKKYKYYKEQVMNNDKNFLYTKIFPYLKNDDVKYGILAYEFTSCQEEMTRKEKIKWTDEASEKRCKIVQEFYSSLNQKGYKDIKESIITYICDFIARQEGQDTSEYNLFCKWFYTKTTFFECLLEDLDDVLKNIFPKMSEQAKECFLKNILLLADFDDVLKDIFPKMSEQAKECFFENIFPKMSKQAKECFFENIFPKMPEQAKEDFLKNIFPKMPEQAKEDFLKNIFPKMPEQAKEDFLKNIFPKMPEQAKEDFLKNILQIKDSNKEFFEPIIKKLYDTYVVRKQYDTYKTLNKETCAIYFKNFTYIGSHINPRDVYTYVKLNPKNPNNTKIKLKNDKGKDIGEVVFK